MLQYCVHINESNDTELSPLLSGAKTSVFFFNRSTLFDLAQILPLQMKPSEGLLSAPGLKPGIFHTLGKLLTTTP